MGIGGYFSLELNKRQNKLHQEAYALNTGRNAFEFILKQLPITKLYVPVFTCDVALEPIEKLSIPIERYRIDKKLELNDTLHIGDDEYLLYTNYFGVKDRYIRSLISQYPNKLILDNAQSLFSDPIENIPTFYSPRKFLGLPDGGYAYVQLTEKPQEYPLDQSHTRCAHLLKRLELSGIEGYHDFKENSRELAGQPIKSMSLLTHRLIDNIDVEGVKRTRLDNFHHLHNYLQPYNQLKIDFDGTQIPMVYPFLFENPHLRKSLIENKVFVATYWPNVLTECKESEYEHYLAKNIIPLPIDQRYGLKEMDRILSYIKSIVNSR